VALAGCIVREAVRRLLANVVLVAVAVVVVVVVVAAPVPAAADDARRRVVAWPSRPDTDLAGVDAAIRDAGDEPVSFAIARTRLIELGARAAAAETEALVAVEAALSDARAAYLQQDFAAMASRLERASAAALPMLARPQHLAVLWEVEFQRGLAELSRRDTTAARSYFTLALALDEARVPRRDVYGPVVVSAFTDAAVAVTSVPPHPTRVVVSPADATVVVDGIPVITTAAPRSIRPGRHVVLASAPGYQTSASIVTLGAGDPIEIALVPADGDPISRIGAAWSTGTLDPSSQSGRRAILAAIAELGATTAVIVDADPRTGEVAARAITETDVHPVERRATAGDAARAALAHQHPDLTRTIVEPPPRRSVFRRWWFWTAVGAAVVTGAGVTYFATRGDDRLRVVAPR
jgi:hypothetical protein